MSCDAQFERYLPLSRWQEVQFCACGHPAHRLILAPILVAAQPECRYDSPIDGQPITSWAARRDDLARHDCVPYDPEMKTDYVRRQEESASQLDKAVEASVEEAIEKMPTKQRGKLYSELTDQGVEARVERRTGPC